jgi:photosystem II stability/assembly factor-like uncharacterized protein
MKRTLVFSLSVIILFSMAAAQSSTAQAGPWQPVSGPYGGSVAALALSPNYAVDHSVYAGLRSQGVVRTVDGGSSWQRAGPDGWVVISLAISPAYASDQTLFATSGLWTAGYKLYRSTDEGNTWQDVTPAWSGLPDPPGLSISPDFAIDRTLYVVGGYQTFISTDGGNTFAQPGGWFATHRVVDLAFSPAYAADRTLFALVPDEGIFKSVDGGTNWTPTGLSGNVSALAVSPDYAGDRMLLAVGEADGQLRVSTDGGDTWSPAALTLGTGGKHTLLFSPTFAGDRIILAASSTDPGAYRSEDGGATWAPVGWYDPASPYPNGFIGGSVYALALAPHTSLDAAAYAGTSSGIYRSNSWGTYWFQGNKGLPRLTVRALAVAPGDPNRLLAGTSFFEHLRFDTGTPGEYDGNVQLSTNGGQTWYDVSGRLERVQSVAFSPGFATDRIAFAAAGTLGQHGYSDGGVYRSTDGGQNWSEVLGNRICKALAFSPAFVTDRTAWVSLSTYSSALGIDVSTNGGDTWTPLAPTVHAQVLVPSPDYTVDRQLFAGTPDSGLQRSTDGGLSWTQVLAHPVTALAISPAYGASRTVYAGIKEITGSPGELYRSTDGGETWQRLETGIPEAVGSDLLTFSTLTFAADGSVLAGVYYGSEDGSGAVYRSIDGGGTWQAAGSGLGDANLFALATVPSGSMSFYAGADTGLWQLEVPQGSPAEPGTWQSGGPRGGRAQALAVSPNFEAGGVVLAGEWVAGRYGDQWGLGIFKSVDGGQTWQPSSIGTEGVSYSSSIHAYAFSPGFASDQKVFAATWGGLFESSDGGEHWRWVSRIFRGAPGAITAVAVAPDYPDSGHVLAGGGYGGVFVSQDGGINWTANYSVSAVSAIAYSPDFDLDNTAFVGSFGLFKTADGGVSWTKVLTQGISALAVSPQFGADGTVFAGSGALYISYDGGANWVSVTLPTDPFMINALAVSPDFAGDRTLFAGIQAGLYRSSDGGTSWEPVAGFPGLAVLSLAISPGWPGHPMLLAGTAQGVYRTTDGGATWALSQGMTALSAEPLALSASPRLLAAGTHLHGIYGSDDSGVSWFPLGLQEMSSFNIPDVAISPNYANDRTMFAVLQSSVTMGGSVYRTLDGGATWERVWGTGYVGPLAISPRYGDDRTVFTTGDGSYVFGSLDGGDTWSRIGEWPPGSPYPVARLVALPSNYPVDSTVFAAGNGFWRLPAGATVWEPAASGLVTDRYVESMAVSPNYGLDQTLLAIAGWTGEQYERHDAVFRSADGGVNWEMANTGLPDVQLSKVAFSPRYAADNTAYVTAEEQLYRSLDGGLGWTAVGAPPGSPGLYEPLPDRRGNVYVTSSAGVWRYSTPAQDIVVNGGFEAGSGWELPATPWKAGYSSRVAYDGARSMRVGIDNGLNAKAAYSSARQVVAIPADAISATLRCSIYPVSGEAALVSQEQAFPGNQAIDTPAESAAEAGDAQYLLLLDPESGNIIRTLFWKLSNAQSWQPYIFDLTSYAGRPLKLHFGVYNNAAGGRTGMYVDDVSLVVQRPASAGQAHAYLPAIARNSCQTHTASFTLSAITTTLSVGETVTVTATLTNAGCGSLGLPEYRLHVQTDDPEPLFDPAVPDPVAHSVAVDPGQSDAAVFVLRAVRPGQATLDSDVSFEVHLGYPGPAYWASAAAGGLVITVLP